MSRSSLHTDKSVHPCRPSDSLQRLAKLQYACLPHAPLILYEIAECSSHRPSTASFTTQRTLPYTYKPMAEQKIKHLQALRLQRDVPTNECEYIVIQSMRRMKATLAAAEKASQSRPNHLSLRLKPCLPISHCTWLPGSVLRLDPCFRRGRALEQSAASLSPADHIKIVDICPGQHRFQLHIWSACYLHARLSHASTGQTHGWMEMEGRDNMIIKFSSTCPVQYISGGQSIIRLGP